jgi:hypothetical protein
MFKVGRKARITRRMRRWPVPLAVLAIALMAAGAAFYLVGHFARRPNTGSFDWELASVFGTAVGTFLLALATGGLAFTTARDVSQTSRLADLALEDREDRVRPIVIGAVTDIGTDKVVATVHNIGLGPAADVGVETIASLRPDEQSEVHLHMRPHDRLADVEVAPNTRIQTWRLPGNYTVTGHFVDRRGRPAGDIVDWVQQRDLATP